MVRIYCGTQVQLPDGYDSRGTRYQCLRKGIGIGLHLVNQAPPMRPAQPQPRLYCGNAPEAPNGYDGLATPYICLRKGVGVGLWKQQRSPRRFP